MGEVKISLTNCKESLLYLASHIYQEQCVEFMSGRVLVARKEATDVASVRSSSSSESDLLLAEAKPINASAITYVRQEKLLGKLLCSGIFCFGEEWN